MSSKRFTKEEIKILSQNPYVEKVTEKYISYKAEFKELCINEMASGTKTLRQIFTENGFDVNIIGQERIENTYGNWLFRKNHGVKLTTGHHENKGRPRTKTSEDKDALIKKQREEIEKLKAENTFLRQLEWLERRYQQKKSPSEEDTN
jgi:hypothetical protein